MDEFELIARCFRDRVLPRPGSVLGIGDDAALVDTGGLPLAHARATTPFRDNDDGAATAGHAFGAAFIRLAAHAVRPRWATLGLTLESGAPERIESFAAAAAAACQTCGVELIGGDTTRGPGRVTVFALGTRADHPLQTAPRPPATAVAVCLPLPPACAPENAHARRGSGLSVFAPHAAWRGHPVRRFGGHGRRRSYTRAEDHRAHGCSRRGCATRGCRPVAISKRDGLASDA